MRLHTRFCQSLKAPLVFAGVLASLSALAQDVAMPPAEIQSQWVGKTVVGTIGAGPSIGKTILLKLNADGTAELGGDLQDSGVWRLTEQGYCATWKKIRGGREGCFTVVKKAGQTQVLNADGSLSTSVTELR